MCGDPFSCTFISRRFPHFLHAHYVVFVSFLLNTPLLRRLIGAGRVSWAHAILFMGFFFILVDPLRTMASAGLVGHNE